MHDAALLKNILGEARGKIQEEISGLLGRTVTLEKPQIEQASKEDFFSAAKRKLVLTRVAVEGELEGEVFLFTPLRDAIQLGGPLIMLPPSELESRIKKEEFGEEEDDAFGEIVNIITGVINALFEENYPKKIRFRKTALESLSVGKIDPAAAEPFPPQNFLLGSFAMKFEEQSLGTLDILFPAMLFAAAADTVESTPLPASAQSPPLAPSPAPEAKPGLPLILILADQGCDTEALAATLREKAFEPTRLGFQEDAREILRDQDVRGVFLVMREVTEQGFAAAIRIRSAARDGLPLIAVGPQWTRNSVLQAVKFGIRDILVAPATAEEIHEKIVSHLLS
jgi:hypothetical protein